MEHYAGQLGREGEAWSIHLNLLVERRVVRQRPPAGDHETMRYVCMFFGLVWPLADLFW
jgi:hypothetical protein